MSGRMVDTLDISPERPVYFNAGAETLFGVLTAAHPLPREAPQRGTNTPDRPIMPITAVTMPGGFGVPGTHRNGMYLTLAQRLATIGVSTFRFDYHGVGESTGPSDIVEIGRPPCDDLHGAIEWLESEHPREIVLVSTCMGARTALATAQRAHIKGLRGVVLVDTPLANFGGEQESFAWHLKRALRPQVFKKLGRPEWRAKYLRMARALFARRAPRFWGLERAAAAGAGDGQASIERSLRALAARSVPVAFVYGEGKHCDDFHRALDGPLGKILERHPARVSVDLIDEPIHGFLTLSAQRKTTDVLAKRVEQMASSRAA